MMIDNIIYEKYNISNYELLDLQKFNIIIGKNGAGKTRLLKELREGFLKEDQNVIYAYFPDMKAHFDVNISEEEIEEIPLYEMIFEGGDIELGNFIQYVEKQGYDFLVELLRDIDKYSHYRNSIRKRRAEEIQKELNTLLGVFVERKLIFESDLVMESNIYGYRKSLKDDLQQMSPGELSLFYLSILLVFIKYNRNSSQQLVLFLDEPELHLHPNALINFLEYLKQDDMLAMCCIATHSIFLTPLFDFYEIIYIEGGKIQAHNSKLYEEIFNSIVGENEKLNDFLISRDMWKYYQFVAECFYLPDVVEKVDIKDKQFLKFLKYVRNLEKKK